MRPRLLDLFCGAGGAAMGYHRADFDVVGVDIEPQPHYPFHFIQTDALDYCQQHGHEYDAIHTSPPCQYYSQTRHMRNAHTHQDLVAATRKTLVANGRPWIIENVPGAPLLAPIMLCGTMFGLKVYRHRLFESSHFLFQPYHHPHSDNLKGCEMISAKGFVCVAGHFAHHEYAKVAMGIDWTKTRNELAQAIPPTYTEYIGRQLIEIARLNPSLRTTAADAETPPD